METNNELRHLAPMYKASQFDNIISIDIETSSKGVLLDIGCYSAYGYSVFANWEEFFSCLLTLKANTRIIAHNGFGFDFITFNQWLLDNRKRFGIGDDDITYLTSESLMIAVIIKRENARYTFLDTLRYFPAQSLQKLAESFLQESKDDVPSDYIEHMEDYKRDFPIEYYSYLRKDCEILYRVYSTALRSFRRWLHHNYKRTRIFSCPTEYLHVADRALRGGMTMYIGDGDHTQHKYENVYHYDVISMYPSVMRRVPTPSSPMVNTSVLVTDYGVKRPGFYLVNFQQTRGRVPILYTIDGEYPQWRGQAILSHFDLAFLDLYGWYEVLDGIVYEDYIFPFRGYLDKLLQLRMAAKNSGQTAKAWALKVLANSLYGKFGQKAIREVISITSTAESRNTLYRMTMCCLVLKVRVQRLAIVLLAHLSLRLQDLNLECYSILIPRFIAIQILSLRKVDLMTILLVKNRVILRKMKYLRQQ